MTNRKIVALTLLVAWAFVAFGWTWLNMERADDMSHPQVFIAPSARGFETVYICIDRTGSVPDVDFSLEERVVTEQLIPKLGIDDSWTVYSIGPDDFQEPTVCGTGPAQAAVMRLPLGESERKLLEMGYSGPANDEIVGLMKKIGTARGTLLAARSECTKSVGELVNKAAHTDICNLLGRLQQDVIQRQAADKGRQICIFVFSDLAQDTKDKKSCPDFEFDGVRVFVIYPRNSEATDIGNRAEHYFSNANLILMTLDAASQTSLLEQNPVDPLPNLTIPTWGYCIRRLLLHEVFALSAAAVLLGCWTWYAWRRS
jgi:hypothetical protein